MFRLCRHRLVHFSARSVESRDVGLVQEMALINLFLGYLHVDLGRAWLANRWRTQHEVEPGRKRNFICLKSELLYLLRKRHYNQELLALFFDTLAVLDTAVKQIDSPEAIPA